MNKVVKAIVIIVVIIVLLIILSKAFNKNGPAAEGERVKVGAILPLSGPVASAGEYAKRGVDLALEDLEEEGNLHIDITIEDGQYDSKTSLNAYGKLKNEGAKGLLVFGSPSAMPLIPLINQDKMPMLALLAASNYTTPDDYAYRIVGSADLEAKAAVELLVDKLGKKRIAVVYINNDYGVSSLAALKKYIGDKAAIVAEEGAPAGATDYRSQVAKIKSSAPDAIFMATLYKEAGLILKQSKEAGVTAPFFCGLPCDNKELLTTAGPAAEDLIVFLPTGNDALGVGQEYQNKYGERATYISLRLYDAVKVLNEAVKECADEGASGECLKQKIDAFENFPGASYPISFDTSGDINDQLELKTIKNGQYMPYVQ